MGVIMYIRWKSILWFLGAGILLRHKKLLLIGRNCMRRLKIWVICSLFRDIFSGWRNHKFQSLFDRWPWVALDTVDFWVEYFIFNLWKSFVHSFEYKVRLLIMFYYFIFNYFISIYYEVLILNHGNVNVDLYFHSWAIMCASCYTVFHTFLGFETFLYR